MAELGRAAWAARPGCQARPYLKDPRSLVEEGLRRSIDTADRQTGKAGPDEFMVPYEWEVQVDIDAHSAVGKPSRGMVAEFSVDG